MQKTDQSLLAAVLVCTSLFGLMSPVSAQIAYPATPAGETNRGIIGDYVYNLRQIAFPDATNNRLGINAVSPTGILDVRQSDGVSPAIMVSDDGKLGVGTDAPQRAMHFRSDSPGTLTALAIENADTTNNNGSVISFRTDTTGSSAQSFYEYAGFQAKVIDHDSDNFNSRFSLFAKEGNDFGMMTLMGNGSVGIGSITPSTEITPSSGGEQDLMLDVEGAIGGTHICDQDGNNCTTPASLSALASGAAPKFIDGTDTADAVYTTGNVGVGTSTPQTKLHIDDSSDLYDNEVTIGRNYDLQALGLIGADTNTYSMKRANKLRIESAQERTNIDYGIQSYSELSGNALVFNTIQTGTQGISGSGFRARVSDGSSNFGENEGSFLRYPDLPHIPSTYANSVLLRNRVDNNYVNAFSLQENGEIRFIQGNSPLNENVSMIVDVNKNVGIGTVLASSGGDQDLKLDVEGAIGATHFCDEAGNNCSTAAGIAAAANGSSNWEADTTNNLIKSKTANGTADSGVQITDSGNIGIGKTPASTRLIDIQSDTDRAVIHAETLDTTNSNQGYSAVEVGTPNSRMWINTHGEGRTLSRWGFSSLAGWSEIISLDGTESGHQGLVIGTQTATPVILATSDTPRAFITANGNVGIGTNTPSEKLDIAGTAKAEKFVSSQTSIGSVAANTWTDVSCLPTGNQHSAYTISIFGAGDGNTYRMSKLDYVRSAYNAAYTETVTAAHFDNMPAFEFRILDNGTINNKLQVRVNVNNLNYGFNCMKLY